MKKIISVIMPIYNAQTFLEESIKSIINQSFQNFELIIINDGSTDNSLSIIKKFMKLDNRIICISRKNKGLLYSLNQGFNLAQGTHIARMDGDDVSLPSRLQMQYDFMINNQLDICGGDYIIISEKGDFKKKCVVPKEKSEILLTMTFNVPFAHPSVMIKKDFLIKNKLSYGMNGYRFAEDLDLWLNMYLMGAKFGNLNIPILKYRIVSNSYSRVNNLPLKWEVAKNYNSFVFSNLKNIRKALEKFYLSKSYNKSREKDAIMALLSYLTFKFDLKLLLKFLGKVSFLNFIFSFMSYVNSKLIIMWIK